MKWVIGGAAVVVLAGAAGYWLAGSDVRAAGVLPYQDPEAVKAGAEIYQDYCASCHGAALQGEPNWQQRDAEGYLPAPPHDASGHTWHHPDAQLLAITKYGVAPLAGDGYRSRMGGYEGVLSEEEMLAVLAYIKSSWPPEVIIRHNQINARADG
ncbi:c-type cytochrome [Leisingera sp. ANG-Vp]|uniref:c-type cytochrome n=1 Tax=Leisingera sp. ANG-Vp TaxID=1577896 RepID=UPI00057D8C41|nr:cytochrome c [Leisingera sp. ANG-Vp]KIC21176.1 cytochrome C [Leisingera sp. ANG-Vp]